MIVLLVCVVLDLCAGTAAPEQKKFVESLEVAQMRKRYSDEQMQLVDQRRADLAEWFALKHTAEYQHMTKEARRTSEQALQVVCRRVFLDLKGKFPEESLEGLARILVAESATIEKDLTSIRVVRGEHENPFVLYEMDVKESLWISCIEIAQGIAWGCRTLCGCCRKKE
jgi:hypothetical protein